MLGHPAVGRPLLTRLAFGSSVPEIASEDVKKIPIPRLSRKFEHQLGEMMVEAAKIEEKANQLENAIANSAEELLEKFLAGDSNEFAIENLP